MSDPILREKTIGHRRVQALGGMHFFRSNKLPYFSLTIASWMRGREDCFGAAHDEILKIWPELKPLADLHLSDINGVPMHAEANGWYWLAGALGGLGERYHGGTADSYRTPTPDGCMEIFANHVRLPINEARGVGVFFQDSVNQYGRDAARSSFGVWVETLKTRWKAEADACIAELGLVVYGDPWVREAVAA